MYYIEKLNRLKISSISIMKYKLKKIILFTIVFGMLSSVFFFNKNHFYISTMVLQFDFSNLPYVRRDFNEYLQNLNTFISNYENKKSILENSKIDINKIKSIEFQRKDNLFDYEFNITSRDYQLNKENIDLIEKNLNSKIDIYNMNIVRNITQDIDVKYKNFNEFYLYNKTEFKKNVIELTSFINEIQNKYLSDEKNNNLFKEQYKNLYKEQYKSRLKADYNNQFKNQFGAAFEIFKFQEYRETDFTLFRWNLIYANYLITFIKDHKLCSEIDLNKLIDNLTIRQQQVEKKYELLNIAEDSPVYTKFSLIPHINIIKSDSLNLLIPMSVKNYINILFLCLILSFLGVSIILVGYNILITKKQKNKKGGN